MIKVAPEGYETRIIPTILSFHQDIGTKVESSVGDISMSLLPSADIQISS